MRMRCRWRWLGVLGAVGLLCCGAAVAKSVPRGADVWETRCGWFSNPTPGNLWLTDREGEWTIGVQGGYQMPGDWEWPAFAPGQWVVTNVGTYGYGCACLQLRVDPQTRHVLAIQRAHARPLTTCRQDRTLQHE